MKDRDRKTRRAERPLGGCVTANQLAMGSESVSEEFGEMRLRAIHLKEGRGMNGGASISSLGPFFGQQVSVGH